MSDRLVLSLMAHKSGIESKTRRMSMLADETPRKTPRDQLWLEGPGRRTRNSVPGSRQTDKANESQELADRLRGWSHRFSGRTRRRNELPGGSTGHRGPAWHGLLAALLSLACACSDGSSDNEDEASGGTASGTGGDPGAGGLGSGAAASGGFASGGIASGGIASGGQVASGGVASGGIASGGNDASGGTFNSGGVPSGGDGGSTGGSSADGGASATGGSGFVLTSPAFDNVVGCSLETPKSCDVFPDEHVSYMDNANRSPELHWTGAPPDTQSFALVLFDVTFGQAHWALWNIPADTTMLAADIPKDTATPAVPAGSQQATANFAPSGMGYFGPHIPCNMFEFQLYALSTSTFSPMDPDSSVLVSIELSELDDSVLGRATLTGRSDDYSMSCE